MSEQSEWPRFTVSASAAPEWAEIGPFLKVRPEPDRITIQASGDPAEFFYVRADEIEALRDVFDAWLVERGQK